MLWWIVGGIVGLFVVFFILGVMAEKKARAHMQAAEGQYFIRFAAAVMFAPLLQLARRPGAAPETDDGIDPERIFPSVLLAGRNVFGDAFTEELALEVFKEIAKTGPDYMSKLTEQPACKSAELHCTRETKDELILGALTAIQLNVQEPGVELLELRRFAHKFYGDEVVADQQMLGTGGTRNLIEESIARYGVIVRELEIGKAAAGQAPGSA